MAQTELSQRPQVHTPKQGGFSRTLHWLFGFHIKYKFMIPALVAIMGVVLFPLGYSFYVSLHHYQLQDGHMKGFVWLGNYLWALREPALANASINTVVLTVGCVGSELLLAFGLALLLNRKGLRFRNIYLSILLLPMLITPVAVGLIWRLLLHPELGIVNYFLGFVGVPKIGWLADARFAMATIIWTDLWNETSLILVIVLAGLTALPTEPFEAAKVDGANAFQTFRFVTWPLMMPVVLIATLLRAIAALKTYDLIYILTRGGPGTTTETISFYVWRQGFVFLDMGRSAAMSFLLLGAIIILTVLLMRVMRSSPA
jgi:multiple sugar transport system permease protein